MPAGFNFTRPGEFCPVLNDVHTEVFKALHRIVWGDSGNDLLHMPHCAGIIDVGLMAGHSEGRRRPVSVGSFACRDQCFGRNAPIVEAIPAHLVTLDEDHARAHLDSTGSDGQSARACAYDAKVRRECFSHAFAVSEYQTSSEQRAELPALPSPKAGLTHAAGRSRLDPAPRHVRVVRPARRQPRYRQPFPE